MGDIIYQTGAEATGEKWRDNYQTPWHVIDMIDMFWDFDWFDAAPVNPKFDGLATPWRERTYINPPFSNYSPWVEYGLTQFRQRVSPYDMLDEQIWMANSSTETKWYQTLLRSCDAFVMPNKRLSFIDPRTNQPAKDNRFPQTIFYRGHQAYKFIRTFNELGSAHLATIKY